MIDMTQAAFRSGGQLSLAVVAGGTAGWMSRPCKTPSLQHRHPEKNGIDAYFASGDDELRLRPGDHVVRII